MVTGLFGDSESVERAYQSVAQRGYDKGDINVIMSDDTRKRYFSDDRQIDTELGSKAAEGGALGVTRLGFDPRWAHSRSTGRRWRRWPGGWPYWSA